MLQPAPESLLFCVDVGAETGGDVSGRGLTRLDAIKSAITSLVHAKAWLSPAHRFGLLAWHQEQAAPTLVQPGVTSNVEAFLAAVRGLQPPSTAAGGGEASSSSSKPLDLGCLVAAAAALQQQEGGAAAGVKHLHGGTLAPYTSSGSSSRPHQQQHHHQASSTSRLRVVLLYCRSCLPAPVWNTHCNAGLAIDCLHIHDKPMPGEQQQQLQEVYSALEALVDSMALKAGHTSLIFETTGKNLGKLLSCMSMLLSHPQQRQPQAALQRPLDLAAAPLQPLPSDAANAARGVPIVTTAPPAAGGAWAKPLSAAALAAPAAGDAASAAAARDPWLEELESTTPAAMAAATASTEAVPPISSHQLPDADFPWGLLDSPQPDAAPVAAGAAGAAAGSSGGVVVGLPAACVTGVPDDQDPQAALELDEGVALGVEASSREGPSTGAASATDDTLADLAASLSVTAAVADTKLQPTSAYPQLP